MSMGSDSCAPLRPRSSAARRASVSFAGDVTEGEDRSTLLQGFSSSETTCGHRLLFRSASQAEVEHAREHSVQQGPAPELAYPFRHVDASYYPEPLSEISKDARRSRLTKVQSSRSVMERTSQRRELWDTEPPEQSILLNPQLKTHRRLSQGQAGFEPPAPLASTLHLRARRSSHGDSLRGKVSGGLLPEAGRPLLPTRKSTASRRSSASGGKEGHPLSHRSSCNSAYEEAVSQGYALPSCQGLSRRSWCEGRSTSIADRIAVQAQKSGTCKPLIKQNAQASTTSPQLSNMGMGMVDAPPAKGIRGVLESIFT